MKVVAAVIIKKNKYLIVKRNKNKHLGLKWEFPGGKVDLNESLEDALKREIKEELDVKITINKKIAEKDYKDEKINITVYYFECFHTSGNFVLNEHEESKWVYKKEMYDYDFVEADRKIFKYLL